MSSASTTISSTAKVITHEWVTKLVVGENLCPFAAPVMPALHIESYDGTSEEELTQTLEALLKQVAESSEETLPTALLIAPNMLESFADYWDWFEQAEDLLESLKLEGILQLASFHPQYQFADELDDDISHFTNRSPYPMVHVIREQHITQALASVNKPEAIPERNKKHMRRLGIEGLLSIMPALAETPVMKK